LKHGSMPKEMYAPHVNTCKIFSCGITAESFSVYDGRWIEGSIAHSTGWSAFKYKGQNDLLTSIYTLISGYPMMVVQAQLQSQCTFLSWIIN